MKGDTLTTSGGELVSLTVGQWVDMASGRWAVRVRRGHGADDASARHYLRFGVREVRVPRWVWSRG